MLRENLNTKTDILLWEILQELKKLNEPKEPSEEPKQFQCKKCSYATDNKGELMVHYRKDHKKEGAK